MELLIIKENEIFGILKKFIDYAERIKGYLKVPESITHIRVETESTCFLDNLFDYKERNSLKETLQRSKIRFSGISSGTCRRNSHV